VWRPSLHAEPFNDALGRLVQLVPPGKLPEQFEDLVRQLVYDFRPWRRLEATGRSGSDDGFDARALEIVEAPDAAPVDQDEPEDERAADGAADHRLWLIQCKRERTISPAKLKGYLGQISFAPEEKLHGIISGQAHGVDYLDHGADVARARILATL